MSGTTVNGGTVPYNFSGASGGGAPFASFFSPGIPVTIVTGGDSTATGSVVIANAGSSDTVSGSAVADTSSGGNSITTINPSTVFMAPTDTVTSAAATTLFGSSGGGGVGHFLLSGANSSVSGGSDSIVGTASGANSTLVGGTGISIFTVTGPNSLAVAGPAGITGIDERASTGPETIATNPLGNSGTLVAILGSGADTVIGGSGASTITGGSGSDVFAFVKGYAGGSEVIIGFNPSDNLVFAGYGYTGSNLPTETVGSTGDVITLSDGTTITLAGFDHKLFS